MEFEPLIEIEFEPGTWTDITPWVRVGEGIRIVRGRGDEQDQVQAGTLAFALNNDGRFTPGNPASPYYPNVRKGRPIRASVEVVDSWLSIANGSFEAGAAGWRSAPVSGGPNIYQQPSWSPGIAGGGTASLRIDWSGAANSFVSTDMTGLTPGRTYTASAYVYVGAGSPAVRLTVPGLASGPFTMGTGTWQRITVTFTATATTHLLSVDDDTAATGTAWVDCVQVEDGSTATAYGPTRITARFSRFFGYVNEWPVTFEGGGRVVISHITATDSFKRLGRLSPLRSLLEEEMLALEPDGYWTLGESSGSSAGDTSGKGRPPLTVYQVAGAGGSVNFGQGTGPGTDGLAAVVFNPASATEGKGLRAEVPLLPQTGEWVLACWFTTSTPGRDLLQLRYTEYDVISLALGLNASGQLRARAYWYNSSSPDTSSSAMSGNLANGLTHFIAVSRWPGQNAVWAWIDGGPTANAFALPNMESAIFYNLLTAGGLTHNGTPNLYAGTLAHVWYAKRGTMPDWTNVWSAGSGSSETTVQRFNRLCRLLGIDGLVLGDSSVQIGAQATSGQPPIEVLREVADVEGGLIYAARDDGRLVFETRASRTTQAVSVILSGTIREDALRWSDDDQHLVNDVTHSREGGAEQRVTDEASIAEYGRYAVKKTLPWGTDSDALEAAQRRVQTGADPRPRITSVRVVTNAIPEHADMLGLDISGVMQVNDLPPGSPANAAAVRVEGYAETIMFNHHEITFNTSPVAFGVGWWLGVPGASELGVTTRIT